MSVGSTSPRYETNNDVDYPTSTSRVPIIPLHTDQELINTIQSVGNEDDDKDTLIGHRTCRFCRTAPQYVPSPCCDCTPIKRTIAGSLQLTPTFDTIFRIAEKAVIDFWSQSWASEEINITKSAIVGKLTASGSANDEHSVNVYFDGTISASLDKSFECEDGRATIKSISGDGKICIAVEVF